MILKLRLGNLRRRADISEYIDDVRETLNDLHAFSGSVGEWRVASPAQKLLPTDQAGLARVLTKHRILDDLGCVMEDMGYSMATFLDAALPNNLYMHFHLGVSTCYSEEGITCEISANLVERQWESLIGVFCSLICRWSPERADIMNGDSLDVFSNELRSRAPVGFAMYGAGVPVIDRLEFAESKEVGEGSILYLTSPKFDLSREEGAQLNAIADLFLIARERVRRANPVTPDNPQEGA